MPREPRPYYSEHNQSTLTLFRLGAIFTQGYDGDTWESVPEWVGLVATNNTLLLRNQNGQPVWAATTVHVFAFNPHTGNLRPLKPEEILISEDKLEIKPGIELDIPHGPLTKTATRPLLEQIQSIFTHDQ